MSEEEPLPGHMLWAHQHKTDGYVMPGGVVSGGPCDHCKSSIDNATKAIEDMEWINLEVQCAECYTYTRITKNDREFSEECKANAEREAARPAKWKPFDY